MKKLIETPEAESYNLEIRDKVVGLVGLQLWFEWRYWVALIGFFFAGFLILWQVERIEAPLIVRILIVTAVSFPGSMLWSYVSWRLQRWALCHRREALLHAVQARQCNHRLPGE